MNAGHIALTVREGSRLTLGAMHLYSRTSYPGKDWDHRECIIYRYLFQAPTGERFVYSGQPLGLSVGEHYDMRATVKRIEAQWGMIRLSRIKIIGRGLKETLL